MKRTSEAIVAAASAAASCLCDHEITVTASYSVKGHGNDDNSQREEKVFTPRFDGLRFIETLITAHR